MGLLWYPYKVFPRRLPLIDTLYSRAWKTYEKIFQSSY